MKSRGGHGHGCILKRKQVGFCRSMREQGNDQEQWTSQKRVPEKKGAILQSIHLFCCCPLDNVEINYTH